VNDEPRARLSEGRVRNLTVEELGLTPPGAGGRRSNGGDSGVSPPGGISGNGADEFEPLDDDDPLLDQVRRLLDWYGGVIFTGPPGTSKTWFAARAAYALAGSSARVRFVQFHASYQYEDFVQGYVPKDDGTGFSLEPKHLMKLAIAAENERNVTHVLVIDELSRADAARVFGEALTYVEKTKRGLSFSLASGEEFSIPPNLVFLATMNPLDRGVDEVDAAFDRRFGKIAMDPSEDVLRQFLGATGMVESLREQVVRFFRFVNRQAGENPQTALGHTFFLNVADETDLRRLWNHQLRFFFEKAYRLDPHGHREVRTQWDSIFGAGTSGGTPAPEGAAPAA
jgi:5-methylcytosine-specific restriction enzyme B